MHTIASFVLPILLVLSVTYLLFQIFFQDEIKKKMIENENTKTRKNSVEKIAQVKLVSDEPKDIEKFITENAQYLSDEMVKRLVERIDMIKTDRVISADTILKKRIDALEPALEVQEEEPVVVKRASRKR